MDSDQVGVLTERSRLGVSRVRDLLAGLLGLQGGLERGARAGVLLVLGNIKYAHWLLESCRNRGSGARRSAWAFLGESLDMGPVQPSG